MTPTQTCSLVLFILYALIKFAHADGSLESSLHNEETDAELVVVRNWTLICEHLCSLNISGPACGSDCKSAGNPVNSSNHSLEVENTEENFTTDQQSELCETLCDFGLGEPRCDCPISIRPAAHNELKRSDRNKICWDFCRFHRVSLRGCSQCPFERKKPLRMSEHVVPPPKVVPLLFPPVTSPLRSEQEASPKLPESIIAFDNPADSSIQVSTTEQPTPDWNRVCAQLCRQGSGGILCNCDLAPF